MINGKVELFDAILSLVPDAQVRIVDNTVEWLNYEIPPVTDDQLKAEIDRLQVEYDNKEYQRLRKQEYPSIGDQLDALFHAGVFPEEMTAQIQAIKDKYPKP